MPATVNPIAHPGEADFWGNDIGRIDFPIVFIRREDIDQRSPRWPAAQPSIDSILEELRMARTSYVSIDRRDGSTCLNVLSGRLVLYGRIKDDTGLKRLMLNTRNGIRYASNSTRGNIISWGTRVRHQGIHCVSGNTFRTMYEEKSSSYKNGLYCDVLISLCGKSSTSCTPMMGDGEVEDAQPVFSQSEESVLATLEHYIDGELELEEQKARETPPFVYVACKPEPIPVVVRQFFRLTLVQEDWVRLGDLKASMLKLEVEGGDDEPVEVIDLKPSPGQPEIIVAVEKQVPADLFADSGRLLLTASPVMHSVRKEIIDKLRTRKAANKWLLGLAADTYNHPKLIPHTVSLPPTKYPPNERQVVAINNGAGSDDYLLVLGPPGTGKTTIILNWVNHFIEQGKRILITSQNNKAVDNVLARLMEKDNVQCVRLGNESKVSTDVKSILIDQCASELQKKFIGKLDDNLLSVEMILGHLGQLSQSLNGLFERLGTAAQGEKMLQRLIEKELTPIEKELQETRDDEADLLAKVQEFAALSSQNEAELARLKRESFILRLIKFPKILLTGRAMRRAGKKAERGEEKLQALGQDVARIEENLRTLNSKRREIESEIEEAYAILKKDLPNVPPQLVPDLPSTIGVRELAKMGMGQAKDQITDLCVRYRNILEAMRTWHQAITQARQQSMFRLLLQLVDVVGATCIGINTKAMFKDIPFDVVIVDESGQIQLHNLIVPLSRAPKAILVGDHKQLPPVVSDEIKAEAEARGADKGFLEKSFFEAIWDRAPRDRKVMLNTQFRCPAIISDYVSEAFYGNDYLAPEVMRQKKPILSFCGSTLVFVDTSDNPRRGEETVRKDDRNEVIGNRLETSLIVDVLGKALEELPYLGDGGKNEIGIIAPYSNHVSQIKMAVRSAQRRGMLRDLTIPVDDLVASVDSFQGQERDLIIYALTRSNRRGAIGFLRDWRRLNVAITRAKKQLIMIGDLSTLTMLSQSNNGDDGERPFKEAMAMLREYVKRKGQYMNSDELQRLFYARPESEYRQRVSNA